ncbi:DKNYY domain-containing protein [bacterium]|nr:DKNYY domain-containing protein [bacterium]
MVKKATKITFIIITIIIIYIILGPFFAEGSIIRNNIKNHIHCGNSTKQKITNNYKKNKKCVFYTYKNPHKNIMIEGAEPETFQHIKQWYGKDNNNIYRYRSTITEANMNKFEVLSVSYAKDDKNVYYRNKKIEGADSDSFKLLRYI